MLVQAKMAGVMGAVTLATLALSGPAFACSETRDVFNNAMTVHSDCSFENGDTEAGETGRDQLSGKRAFDRGNGRVAQALSVGGFCSSSQLLVFTECETGRSIAIRGIDKAKPDEPRIGYGDSIAFIQPPHGPIRADVDDTVESLSEQARKERYSHVERGSANDEHGYWTRYRSNCGCKLFYPDSKAARASWARTGN